METPIFSHNLSPSQELNLEESCIAGCSTVPIHSRYLCPAGPYPRRQAAGRTGNEAPFYPSDTRLDPPGAEGRHRIAGTGRNPATDRRLIRGRIKAIEKRLEKVRSQRDQGRRSRRRAELPTVSLVGYTNAGKSSLFNALTEAGVLAVDQLFATLDPTMRRLTLADAGPVILADTVGFVSHLPHKLIEAFATLEEAVNATLLLHVIDAASPERHRNIERVEEVLQDIGADDIPVLRVYNKIDLLEHGEPQLERDADGVLLPCGYRRTPALAVTVSGHGQLLVPRTAQVVRRPNRVRVRSRFGSAPCWPRPHWRMAVVLEIRMPETSLAKLLKNEDFDGARLQAHDARALIH